MDGLCNCDDCVPDPSWTCSYTGEDVSIDGVYIANAYRGNLILCPGGSNGAIGGLLHQLNPPQHYSHMGIMVKDHDLIRHSTVEQRWLTSEEYYTGNVLGVAAPVDGLNPDHVQHGWPGSITQSAEQVFLADRYGDTLTPPGHAGPYHGSDLVDKESPSGKSYRIAALSFDGVVDNRKLFPALVVKPCSFLETPAVREGLDRVADQVMQIYTHYRFYCYTNGNIGSDPDYWGGPTDRPDAQPDWDPVTLKWKDWSDPSQVKWVNKATIPAVCSSFVWQAVQNANKAGLPQLRLDWADTQADALGEEGGKCSRALPPDWSADTLDPLTLDGLYAYDEGSRAQAAAWLHDSLSEEVFKSLKGSLADKKGVMKVIADAIDDIGRASFIVAAEAGAAAVVALLSGVLSPAVAAVFDIAFAEQLIELLYDMPDDIANQMCNSFAFDCHRGFPADGRCLDAAGNEIHDVDSDNWRDAAGTGHAVSPDNIHMFWDAPGPSDPQTVQGLYGYNKPVQPVVGVVRRPKCVLVPSTGTATIRGFVVFKGNRVTGAYVKVNCQHTISDANGYSLSVRSGGQYKVVARFEDSSGIILYGERATGRPGDPPIAPGAVVPLDILLSEPPACMRNIFVNGTVRVDDVTIFGADHNETTIPNLPLYVQYGVARFDEDTGQWVIDPNDPVGVSRRTDVAQVGASKGDADGELKIEVVANADLSVDVTVTGTLNPNDENISQTKTVHVPAGATVPIDEFDLATASLTPDRAYFRQITITNQAASAI